MAVEHDYLKRSAKSDSSVQNGRFALLGAEEPTGVLVSVNHPSDTTISNYRGGVLARYVSTTRYLMLVKISYTKAEIIGQPQKPAKWVLYKRTAAGEFELASGEGDLPALFVGRDGICRLLSSDLSTPVLETAADADLATGGELAKGKYGIYDAYTGASTINRVYRSFLVMTAATDPVLFANLDARLTHLGHYRRSADNKAYGPVHYPGADNLRIPVSGPEERPVEIGIRPSRGDFAALADAGLDKAKGVLTYRPCWSYVPED